MLYVAACDPDMQVKMYRDALEAAGFPKEQLRSVDIRNMDTAQAVNAIKELIQADSAA